METLNYIIPVWHSRGNIVGGSDYKYRVKNINRIVSESLSKQTAWKIRLIIAEQRMNDKMYFLNEIDTGSIETVLLDAEYFIPNKCWLNNIAVHHAHGQHILFAENDTLCEPDHFNKLFDHIKQEHLDWCIGWNKLSYMDYDQTRIIKNISLRENKGAEGGLVYFKKDFFNHIGCYNEWIEELGGPDNEIVIRAKFMSFYRNTCPGIIYHLWHPSVHNDVRPTPIRKRNSKIFKFTKANPETTIEFLKKENQGSKNGPACKYKPFPLGV